MLVKENLVLDSAKELQSADYFIGYSTLCEDWIVGQEYALSFDVLDFQGGDLRNYTHGGHNAITEITKPTKSIKRYSKTFTCEAPPEGIEEKRMKLLGFYNFPRDGGSEKNTVIKNVKLEKGSEVTFYIPNKEDLKHPELYPVKVSGGVQSLPKSSLYKGFRGCVLC